jgi:hypothetical protein
MTELKPRPKGATSLAEKELDKAEKNFEEFDQSIQAMTKDRLDATPKEETAPQLKISNREAQSVTDHYLKPHRVIGCRDKFNEKFRAQYEFAKEYVPFIAEHNEVKGETIDIWTRPFAGMPAEWWKVPTNKPIWGPRYLAEQIKSKFYHRLVMNETVTNQEGHGTFFGQLAADTTVQRLDARPVSQKKSVFMGAGGF